MRTLFHTTSALRCSKTKDGTQADKVRGTFRLNCVTRKSARWQRALLCAAGLSLTCAMTAGMAGAQTLGNQPQGFSQTPDTGAAAAASAPAVQPDEAAPQLPALGEGILVAVNDDMITSYDLKQRMLLLIVTSGIQITQENYASFQQQALTSLIDEHLQEQEMAHWKVTVGDDDVKQEIDRMAAQSNLTGDQLLNELKKVGVDSQTLRDQIRAETGWSQLVGGRYHSNAAVGKAQVDSMMDKAIADGQKKQFLISEIMLDPAQAGGLPAAQKGAQQLYQQIAQKVAPFQAVARQFSNAPSAANGGDAGWQVADNLDPAIESALEQMNPGQMSPPITTKDGVYLIMLRQKTDGNSDMVMHLKQAAVPLPTDASPAAVSSAQTALLNFRSKADSCDAIDAMGDHTPSSVSVTDLGEAQLSLLQPTYSDALRPLKEGQVTGPLRNAQYMNVVYVCDRQLAGDNALTRDQVESQLVNQRLSMLGKRYLRELRAVATIENH